MLSLLIILATPPVLQVISCRSFFRGCLQPSTRAAVASDLRILFIDMPAFDIPISLFSIPIVYLLAIVPHVQKVYLPRHLRLLRSTHLSNHDRTNSLPVSNCTIMSPHAAQLQHSKPTPPSTPSSPPASRDLKARTQTGSRRFRCGRLQ